MARELFNFIWVMPPSGEERRTPAPQQTMLTARTHRLVTPGVILFPAFMTPLVYVEGRDEAWLELLIATEHTLTPEMVNRQLKLSQGMSAEKSYNLRPLFGGAHGHIRVESQGRVEDDKATVYETHSKFAGILHPSYAHALSHHDIEHVYRVKISASAIPDTTPAEMEPYSERVWKFTHYDRSGTRRGGQALRGKELSDRMIREMTRQRFGPDSSSNDNPIPGRGRYAFPRRGSSVDLGRIDPDSPIQSYHPLVVMRDDSAKDYLDLGHVSDIHINTRWQFLGKSPARVIEYPDDHPAQAESPTIGSVLAENNRNFHDVLGRLCGEADVMVVGGDVIDHIRNAYNGARAVSRSATVRQIWEMMDLGSDATYTDATHPVGPDLLAFFSFILDSIKRHSMPFFGITGNHDCYVDAFGISPRVGVGLGMSNRTNEGIPADLNLTFYEALLAFGPTAGWLVRTGSSFRFQWFDWFHLVLTPFNDWWFKFPHQSLVGLGWGNSEDLYADEQGVGHLPRSEDGVSTAQLGLLRSAVGERNQRKVTLTSHFTFLSFNDPIPMNPAGDVRHNTGRFSSGTWLTDGEMGTFELNRDALVTMLDQGQLQCVLTGHSHRRGLYVLGNLGEDGIAATIYDTDPRNDHAAVQQLLDQGSRHEPFVVVSDSAGPYPRHNRGGEFGGWGSDKAGGTLICFGNDGNIRAVEARTATSDRPKPRAAVAMDYFDVSEEGVFVDNRMHTSWMTGDQMNGRAAATIVVHTNFTRQVRSTWSIHIRKLIFAGYYNGSWVRIETTYNRSARGYLVQESDRILFLGWLRLCPTKYVSLKLHTGNGFLRNRYDWNSHWNFEVTTESDTHWTRASGDILPHTEYRFFIQRPQRTLVTRVRNVEWREIPNFQWRRTNLPKYQ